MKISLADNRESSNSLFDILLNENIDSPNNYLAFLGEDRINTIKENLNENNRAENLKDTTFLQDLWKDILIDAIYFLRINDYRENAFFDRKEEPRKKTTMRSDYVADAAMLNVYGIDELFNYFKMFTKFESTLYGADKYYRDHLLHPIMVWIIGINFLNEFGSEFVLRVCNNAEIYDNDCADREFFEKKEARFSTNLKISTAELSAMWAITALTHDLGYPLEKVEKINDQLEMMLAQFGKIGFSRSRFNFETQHDHLVKFLLNFISSVAKPIRKKYGGTYIKDEDSYKDEPDDKYRWITHKRTKYFTKFSKSWEMFDHGIVSSLILLKSLTFFIESDHSSDYFEKLSKEDARQFAIRSEVLHSIASHTTPKIYHLTANNLPFLLILCDDIHEWSRPTLGDMRLGFKGSAIKVDIEKLQLKNRDESKIHCSIQYDDIDYDLQKRFAQRIFKIWLERFRPALDDNIRSIDFRWKLQFGSWGPWEFHLKTSDNVIKPYEAKGPKKGRPKAKYKLDLFEDED